MAKTLTFDQAAERKRKAEAFVRDVLGDEDRADEISDEDVLDYANRRHFTIKNPPLRKGNQTMADTPTRQDLLDQIADLQDENDALCDQLTAIADVLDQGDADDDDDDDDGNGNG
jgi:hypothetical protein